MVFKSVKLFAVVSLLSIWAVWLMPNQVHAQKVMRVVYVSPETENLRSRPNGPILGILNQGTSLGVIEERDDWVKVQLIGWIWKGSLGLTKPFDTAGAYRAQHILVKTKAEAEEVLRQLKGGADFAETAKKKSVGPNAANGGDLGYFNPDDFLPEFSQAISALKVGEISGIVETELGFSIFKRLK